MPPMHLTWNDDSVRGTSGFRGCKVPNFDRKEVADSFNFYTLGSMGNNTCKQV